MTIQSEVLTQVRDYATRILKEEMPPNLHYHNYKHTHYVAKMAEKIGKQSNLSDEELETVVIAAWFHDLGYREKSIGHEDLSKEIAQTYLDEHQFPKKRTKQVLACIDATKIPQSPTIPMAEVLCDADLHHLSEEDFFTICDPLRREWEVDRGHKMSDLEWLQINYDFLKGHQYFTAYGKAVLEERKQNNIKSVKKKLKKLQKEQSKQLSEEMGIDEKELKKLQKKLDKVENRSERGVETVFRITSRNHLDLSSMADSKANIMISVNTIIISVIISILLQQIDTHPHLIIPTAILLCTCVATIVFAVLATRPNVSSGRFTRDDIENRRTNLLFFGNFHKMRLEDYEWGMREMLNDGEYLYGSLIRDIYFLGRVLGEKYKLLRTAYTIFMFGLVISVFAFIISVVFFRNEMP